MLLKIVDTEFLGSLLRNSRICRPVILVLVEKTAVPSGFPGGDCCPLAGFSCHQLSAPLLKACLQPSTHKHKTPRTRAPAVLQLCVPLARGTDAVELLRHKEERSSLEISSEQQLMCVPGRRCHPVR